MGQRADEPEMAAAQSPEAVVQLPGSEWERLVASPMGAAWERFVGVAESAVRPRPGALAVRGRAQGPAVSYTHLTLPTTPYV